MRTGLLAAALLFALLPSRAAAGVLYDLGNGASTATLRLTGPLRLVGSKTTLSTYRIDLDPVLSHVKKSSANGTVEFEVTKYGVVNSTTQAAARWTRTTAQSIPNDTNTLLILPNKEYNTQSFFAITHATVPTGMDGLYSVRAFVSFATGSSASDSVSNSRRRNLSVLKNGSVIVGCSDVKISVGNTDETRVNVGCTPHLVAGDTISVQVYQNEGSAQNVNSASLEIVKLW